MKSKYIDSILIEEEFLLPLSATGVLLFAIGTRAL